MSTVEAYDLALIFGLFTLHLLVPGPSMLYICVSASRGGRGEALCFAIGTALGTTLWAAVVAFGVWPIIEGTPFLADSLRSLAGAALVLLGGQAILAAFGNAPIAASDRRHGRLGAVLRGILVTAANGNEFVFWSAVLVLGAKQVFSPAFVFVLVAGAGAVSLAFDATLACLASGGGIGRVLLRLRRFLEAALGAAFCLTGGLLLGLV